MAKHYLTELTDQVLPTPLFSRFESDRPADLDELARDIADILGARCAFPYPMPGVLGWGLSGLSGLAPSSGKNRQAVAALIETAINRFEPRLKEVRVTPVSGTTDFTFTVDATLERENDETVKLRILSPHRGGALGASVKVLEHS